MPRLRPTIGLKPIHVFLPVTVISEMELLAESHEPRETGGALLGYCDRDDPHLLQIVRQVGPGPRAVHACDRFEPDGEWQYAQIAEAYGQSGRVVTYLGDWHSHPGGSARPSRIDHRTARRVARTRQARTRHPLMLILWGPPKSRVVAAYQWRWYWLRAVNVVNA